MYRVSVLLFFLFFSFHAWAQSGVAEQVQSRIEKKKWAKAEQVIAKSLLKDTVNVEANYAAALLSFSYDYPHYNLDSAHHYILTSLSLYAKVNDRDKEKLKKLSIDSALLLNQKKLIDEAAFTLAKSVNTEKAYHYFITHYATANKINEAVELRDEVAFLDALKVNTYSSFFDFLKKYPWSHRAADAQKRYDKLLYEDLTRDERLKSYETFVREFPASPYATNAEQQIMQIRTADGAAASFIDFIKQYPHSKWTKQARNILFHLDHEGDNAWKETLTDSLRETDELNQLYWVPFLKGDRYGFMDANGVEKIQPVYNDIDPEYLCGDVRTDYLLTSQGIISRSGRLIYQTNNTEEVEDIGAGFLGVFDKQTLVHKSGFVIHIDGLSDAHIIADRFIAVNKESGWGLISFTGRLLLPYVYDDISFFNNWIVLIKKGRKILVTASQVSKTADKISLSENLAFDDIRKWGEHLCWVKNGSLEGVLNEDLDFTIPLDRQTLEKTPFGFIRRKADQQFAEGINELKNKIFKSLTIQGKWLLATQHSNSFELIDIHSGKKVVADADSIWFEKNIAMTRSRDSVRAWINSHTYIDFNPSEKVSLFSRDSSVWMVATEKSKKTVYDALSGQRLFTAEFDQIGNVAEGFFLLTKANKKGLIDIKGKVLLNIEYDAIIQTEAGKLSLLKDKKFGLYDMPSRKLIKPMYERNVVNYNKKWLVAYKEGAWGFIDSDSKPVGKFQFNEILYWNDTAAWVKENFQWKIYGIKSMKMLQDKIKDFRYVKKLTHEHIVIIHQDNYYGVISNQKGVVIPSTFTDIVNVGDTEKPMYFTEKHVEEADISVVIYYNEEGRLLRRQAFESADEYERIFCTKK